MFSIKSFIVGTSIYNEHWNRHIIAISLWIGSMYLLVPKTWGSGRSGGIWIKAMASYSCLEGVKMTRRPGSFRAKLPKASLAHSLWLFVPWHVCLKIAILNKQWERNVVDALLVCLSNHCRICFHSCDNDAFCWWGWRAPDIRSSLQRPCRLSTCDLTASPAPPEKIRSVWTLSEQYIGWV